MENEKDKIEDESKLEKETGGDLKWKIVNLQRIETKMHYPFKPKGIPGSESRMHYPLQPKENKSN